MKKIYLVLIVLILTLTSCAAKHTFVLNDDGTITMDETLFYPLANSERFTDYGYGKKQGAVLGGDVYIVDGNDTILFVKRDKSFDYYVPEKLKGFDKPLEECTEFFYVPLQAFDKTGRVDRDFAEKSYRLTGEDAVDFAFYVFYGRPPKDYGYDQKQYAGEIYGVFSETDSIVSAYSVYKYDDDAYSVVIDDEEYLMEVSTAEMIGVMGQRLVKTK